MPRSPSTAVAAFSRKAVAGAFAAGALRAVLVLAAGAATLLLGARLFGGYVAPHPVWAAAIAPVLAFAWFCARRERPTPAIAAAHLDRRLGLGGLLLCEREGLALDPAQRQRLTAGLALLPTVLPRIRWRALLPWPFTAALLATAVALLPPPPAPPLPLSQQAAAGELERLSERLRDLFARGEVPAETQRELERKLQDLQLKLANADVPEWRDLDELDRRLDREQLLQATAATPPNGSPDVSPGASSGELSAASLAAAAEALAAAGRLDDLPAALRAMLQQAQRADGTFAAEGLPQDAEALRRLAAAMAAAAQQPGALRDLAALADGQLADLRDVLAQFGAGAAGEGAGDNDAPGEGTGRGGVDRGPGHAALAMTEDAQGGATGALPLPPGTPVPSEWVPLGSRRIEPETAPVTNSAAGGQGAAGAGGASWQLDLAPHTRAVVQRFFATGDTPTNAKDKR